MIRRFRRWRAAHYLYLAHLAYDENPSPLTALVWARAKALHNDLGG